MILHAYRPVHERKECMQGTTKRHFWWRGRYAPALLVLGCISIFLLFAMPKASAATANHANFTAKQYATVVRNVESSKPRLVKGLPPAGKENARHRQILYWRTHPAAFKQMRQEVAAGKWYQSPRAWLWRKVNAKECTGRWTCNTGNGYYGGLQMDYSFQRTYNAAALRLWGTANNWPIAAQMKAADRAYRSRGLQPWPSSYAQYGYRPAG